MGSLFTLALVASVAGCGGGSGDASDGGSGGASASGGTDAGSGGSGKSGAGNGGTSGKGGTSGSSGSAGTGATENSGDPTGNADIDPTGGTVTNGDHTITVDLPAGAVADTLTVSVMPTDPPADGAFGTVYEIEPTGTVFAAPVTITLSYDGIDLGSTDESSLRVATYGDAGWQILAGAVLDTKHHTVSGLTSHLSPYGVISTVNGVACANVARSQACAGASAGGSASGSAGGSNSGSAGSSSSAGSCPQPTCADSADACSGYPGSTMSDCHDDATLGLVASCCFAPEAPICFLAGKSVGCAGGTAPGGSASSGDGASCPGTPTCADAADACAGYPGAKFQDCTEDSSGYSGSCCFDPGKTVCVAVSAPQCASTGGGCPAPATCADGDPCAGLPGATLSDCADTDAGFAATCCFANGTVPPSGGYGASTLNSGSAGAPSSSGTSSAGAPSGGAANGGASSSAGTDGVAGAPAAGSGGSDAGVGGSGGTAGQAASPGK